MLFLLIVFLLSCVLCNICLAYRPNYLVATRQDETNYGYIETIDGETGVIKITNASDEFQFTWPYVEMTVDLNKNQVYTLVILEEGSAVIYKLQSSVYSLNSIQEYNVDNSLTIFDLQYSTNKETIFGIKVTGKYERTLSNIQLTEDVIVVNDVIELYNLPEYWYVNASSYDSSSDIYFALLNNFPSLSNSTNSQKLAVVDFSSYAVGSTNSNITANIYDLMTYDNSYIGQLQFISYSQEIDHLFAAGINLQSNTAYVVMVNTTNGLTTKSLVEIEGAIEIGPLVVHSNHGTTSVPMNLFIRTGQNKWDLWFLEYSTSAMFIDVQIKAKTYEGSDYHYFAAAVKAFAE